MGSKVLAKRASPSRALKFTGSPGIAAFMSAMVMVKNTTATSDGFITSAYMNRNTMITATKINVLLF